MQTTLIREAEAPVVTFIHEAAPDRSMIQRVSNAGWVKPNGGIWTSPQGSTYGWREWCASESFGSADAQEFTLTPKPGTRVAVIDSLADLEALIAFYPSEDIIGKPVLDFEAMARDYDGLWLTEEGQWATRMTTPGLYGFDMECILFFRWVFA